MMINSEPFTFSNYDLEQDFNLSEILFERVPMGVAVLDRNYRIQRYNPTWAEFSTRYAPKNAAELTTGEDCFSHIPDDENKIRPFFERVLAGETIKQKEMPLISGGESTYWDFTLAPLIKNDHVVGILIISIDTTERIKTRQTLEERVNERTLELNKRSQIAESLGEIINELNSSQSLESTLSFITQRACLVLQSQACLIHEIQEERNFVAIQASYGLPQELLNFKGFPLYSAQSSDENILNNKPVWVNDFSKAQPLTLEEKNAMLPDARNWRELTDKHFQAWLAVPLIVSGDCYGSMSFFYDIPQAFDEGILSLSQNFANQAALAIENARLYEEIEQTSRIAERNRLARDLHDAVTQTLFSSSMIADVLPRIWERSPEEGKQRLEEIRRLTKGALSEMRTLLVELRPSALEDIDLGTLISHQTNAFTARTAIPVEINSQSHENPPVEIKEMFYRIAQEAFNNIAKHAGASSVTVKLDSRDDRVRLTIEDKGNGFDPELIKTKGLGLNIMQERAENLNATIKINSRIGIGTTINIAWSANTQKQD